MQHLIRRLMAPIAILLVGSFLGTGCLLWSTSEGQIGTDPVNHLPRIYIVPGMSSLLVKLYVSCVSNNEGMTNCFSPIAQNYVNDDPVGLSAVWDCESLPVPACGVSVPPAVIGLAFTQPADDVAYRCMSFEAAWTPTTGTFYWADSWKWYRPSNTSGDSSDLCPPALTAP